MRFAKPVMKIELEMPCETMKLVIKKFFPDLSIESEVATTVLKVRCQWVCKVTADEATEMYLS